MLVGAAFLLLGFAFVVGTIVEAIVDARRRARMRIPHASGMRVKRGKP